MRLPLALLLSVLIHAGAIVPWGGFRNSDTTGGAQTYIAVNLRVAKPDPASVRPTGKKPSRNPVNGGGNARTTSTIATAPANAATGEASKQVAAQTELPSDVDSEATTTVAAVPPEYPEAALRNQIEGCVLASITVSEVGDVSAVKIIATDHPGIFDQSVIESQQTARYIPARKNGEARESRVLAVATFVLGSGNRLNCPLRMAAEARRLIESNHEAR
jgi:TonB family protein